MWLIGYRLKVTLLPPIFFDISLGEHKNKFELYARGMGLSHDDQKGILGQEVARICLIYYSAHLGGIELK